MDTKTLIGILMISTICLGCFFALRSMIAMVRRKKPLTIGNVVLTLLGAGVAFSALHAFFIDSKSWNLTLVGIVLYPVLWLFFRKMTTKWQRIQAVHPARTRAWSDQESWPFIALLRGEQNRHPSNGFAFVTLAVIAIYFAMGYLLQLEFIPFGEGIKWVFFICGAGWFLLLLYLLFWILVRYVRQNKTEQIVKHIVIASILLAVTGYILWQIRMWIPHIFIGGLILYFLFSEKSSSGSSGAGHQSYAQSRRKRGYGPMDTGESRTAQQKFSNWD